MKIKKNNTYIRYVLIGVLFVVLIIGGVVGYLSLRTPTALRVAYFDYPPARVLGTMFDDFTKETGIPIEYTRMPIGEYLSGIEDRIRGRDPEFDVVVADSQSLGGMVEEGVYLELTDIVRKYKLIGKTEERVFSRFSEYPEQSGKYYAIPTLPDAVVMAYRVDKFNDPLEKAAYHEQYGKELHIPRTWEEVLTAAEFFTRPEEGQYGIGFLGQTTYDASIMTYGGLLYAYGGSWQEIDSPGAVQALTTLASLKKFLPDTHKKEGMIWGEAAAAFAKDEVVMAIDFIPPMDVLFTPETNPYYATTEYSALPFGTAGQASSLGGQAFSIVAASKEVKNARRLLEWWVQDETQNTWTDRAGYPVFKRNLSSASFLERPYAKAYSDSMNIVIDFWNVPGYADLIRTTNTAIYDYVFNTATHSPESAQSALTALRKEWDAILK